MDVARADALTATALTIAFQGRTDGLHLMLRSRLARLVGDAMADAYRSGEVDFLQALGAVDKVAAGSGDEKRIEFLGELAIKLLELGKPKYLGHSRPLYPEWLKNLAVDLVSTVREEAPWTFDFDSGLAGMMPAQKARVYAAGLLARLQLCQQPISERTLHDWCLERQRALGKPAKRGRPRTRK